MKKYNSSEENTIVSSQLYFLEKQIGANSTMLNLVGDLLPGVVLINNMFRLQNDYMSKVGCEFFDKSRTEIHQLGHKYFGDDYFCQNEIAWVAQHFGGLAQRNDENEVTGFYQKVRSHKNADWKQFYLSGKLLTSTAGSFIYLGMEVKEKKASIGKIAKAIDAPIVDHILFQKFNSLTKREKEVLALIAAGHTNKNIADYLFIANYTVETHRKNINMKLGTKTLSDLIRIALLFNLSS